MGEREREISPFAFSPFPAALHRTSSIGVCEGESCVTLMQLGPRVVLYSCKQHLIVFIACVNSVWPYEAAAWEIQKYLPTQPLGSLESRCLIKGHRFVISEKVKRFKGPQRKMSTEAEGGWGAVRKKVEKREKKKIRWHGSTAGINDGNITLLFFAASVRCVCLPFFLSAWGFCLRLHVTVSQTPAPTSPERAPDAPSLHST